MESVDICICASHTHLEIAVHDTRFYKFNMFKYFVVLKKHAYYIFLFLQHAFGGLSKGEEKAT